MAPETRSPAVSGEPGRLAAVDRVSPRRRPTRRTVSIHSGWPSLRRSDATCTSTVLVGPYQWGSHTSSRMVWRLTTAPGSSASRASRSNSFGDSVTSAPSTRTRRDRRSTVRPPRTCTWSEPGGLGAAAHDRPDPGHQLPEAEGLDDVVVGSQLQPDDPVHLGAPGGQDQDRHDDRARSCRQTVVAVHIGQTQVQQHHVGRGGAQGVRRRWPPGSRRTPPGQALGQRLGDAVVVLDHQDPHPQKDGMRPWGGGSTHGLRRARPPWERSGAALRTRAGNPARRQPRAWRPAVLISEFPASSLWPAPQVWRGSQRNRRREMAIPITPHSSSTPRSVSETPGSGDSEG